VGGDEVSPAAQPLAGGEAGRSQGDATSDQPKAAVAVETPSQKVDTGSHQSTPIDSAATAGSVSSGASSPARDELAVVATNGHAAPLKAAANGNGAGTVTLSLGTTNVAFKIQEDAPSCAECGSIMVRNGSCYKCLNCGSTSGCS
jgi:ribonucleoside-diphosphate reductase alpha chain